MIKRCEIGVLNVTNTLSVLVELLIGLSRIGYRYLGPLARAGEKKEDVVWLKDVCHLIGDHSMVKRK